MFQNIARDFEEEQSQYEDVEFHKQTKIKEMLKRCFTKRTILLYIVSFMLSIVGIGADKEIAPFGIAVLAAVLSNCIPVGMVSIILLIGTYLFMGGQATLSFVLTILFLVASILLKAPKYTEERNEKRKIGMRLFFSCLIVQVATLFFQPTIYVYDVLASVVYCILAYVFYKIFVNSIPAVIEIGENKVYSIEEIMGASLLIAIAATSIGGITVFGYSIRNILCILVVLVMGWKNGMLVGATAGITIGTVLGIIGTGEPVMVASYALSGLVAGIFSKFGKIGVVVGFLLGNVVLTYVANGNTQTIISIQEILIACLGLLALPKNIKINIEDIYPNERLLPETTGRNLEENRDTVLKLNSMSETIYEMAKTYQEAAATIVDEEELRKQETQNRSLFERELEAALEGMEDNILFDDIYAPSGENQLVDAIFETLLEKEEITRKDLLSIFANHNNYIVGYEKDYIEEGVEEDLARMVKAINNAYRVSKMGFIWKKKIDENKKAVSKQLEEVSKAIGGLAEELDEKEQEIDEFAMQKEEIKKLMEQKEIANIKQIRMKKAKTGRLEVTLSTKNCEDVENNSCDIKKMTRILSNVCEEPLMIQKQECGLREHKEECSFTYVSKDKQNMQIGVAQTTKTGSILSGDTNLQVRLEDGKHLIAISDGMGSGEEARKSSKMAISMLEKLLSSGFEKDTSLKLINSALHTACSATGEPDMYATLDIAIFDLYAKNLEFIKNGACPTFVKHGKEVQILKSVSLPTGILNDIDLIVYDRDLQEGDILVMCSDGIIDSTTEFTNKELWLKFLLEDITTEDAQKIADIILQEAIDNGYGTCKDDMTVMVMKIK